jgi:hypothetical protein
MKIKFTYILFFAISIFFNSCEKDNYLGPSIETLYGQLIILEPFTNNKPVGVDFSNNDTVIFNSSFSISADYQINITGRNSGATYALSAVGSDLSEAYWRGESDNVFFKQYEWCDLELTFNGFDTVLTDSVLILGERDFSNVGLLLTSFEEPNEYTIVDNNIDVIEVNNDPNLAIHGSSFLNAYGIGNATWFGAVRFSWSNSIITETNPSNVFFNGFYKSSNQGSAFVLKVFEDENSNGTYDAGIDEAYSVKTNLITDGQWRKYNIPLNELTIDQSGNNTLIDGVLEPNNIIRIDITNSQSGTAQGEFGYTADYFIITYNNPL